MYIFLNFRDRNSEEELLKTPPPPAKKMIKSQNKRLNVSNYHWFEQGMV